MAFTGTRCFEDRKTLLIERKVPLAACSSDWRSGFDSPSRFFAAALVLQLYNAVQSRKFQPASQSSAVGTSLELESHAKRYLI